MILSRTTELPEPILNFAGQVFIPLPSGALYWPDKDTLLVADLHLEKMASFATKGQFLPPYDTTQTLQKLVKDLHITGARKVIALGDSFHRDDSVKSLQPADLAHVQELVSSVAWVWLSGNHDPKPHAIGGICMADFQVGDFLISHEPTPGDNVQIAGHLHPAAHIAINAVKKRSACFVADPRLLILPAYGRSTGSLNILSAPFHGLLRYGELQIMMLGRERIYPVSEKRLIHR